MKTEIEAEENPCQQKIFIRGDVFGKTSSISRTRSQPKHAPFVIHRSSAMLNHHIRAQHLMLMIIPLSTFLIPHRSRDSNTTQWSYGISAGERDLCVVVLIGERTNTRVMDLPHSLRMSSTRGKTQDSSQIWKYKMWVSFGRFIRKEKKKDCLENIETTKADQVERKKCYVFVALLSKFLFHGPAGQFFVSTRFWWLHSYGIHKSFQKKNSSKYRFRFLDNIWCSGNDWQWRDRFIWKLRDD